MSTDPTVLAGLGRLARLALDQRHQADFAEDLSRMLVLLDQLRAVDVEGVVPLAHPHDIGLPLRDDCVTENDQSAALLALAPETHAGFYLVPRVLD